MLEQGLRGTVVSSRGVPVVHCWQSVVLLMQQSNPQRLRLTLSGNTVGELEWCSPTVCCLQNHASCDEHIFLLISIYNGPNLLSTEGALNETGILDPVEFWGVP